MKIFIRGGVWTNVEDQVLLAAYMKYGGNQWLRIASLLPRKTASQVKARWEEYLDPTLRKTPWTYSEDEKLLHLARLMPMQWRTIAQYFGRSAYQCVERYRELVDKASATPHYDDNDAAIAHEMMPQYETLHAIPDSTELDLDEKEMLAEARARLANTQGKKARRKARERQLDVMRKIVKLRKKRELEAAGIILEEKNMWEKKEFEVDVLTTHVAKSGNFDTSIDDEVAKEERIRRIKRKIENRKKAKELKAKESEPNLARELGHLTEELAKEEEKLKLPVDSHRTGLIMPTPQIPKTDYKIIQKNHLNGDLSTKKHNLSLFERHLHKQESEYEVHPISEENIYKTQAVDKELPRPVPLDIFFLNSEVRRMTYYEIADQFVLDEAIKLAYRDAKQFPPPKTKSNQNSLIYGCNEKDVLDYYSNFDDINPESLIRAEELINEEINGKKPDYDEFVRVWIEIHKNDDESMFYDFDNMVHTAETKVNRLRQMYSHLTKNSDLATQNLLSKLNREMHELDTLQQNLEFYRRIKQAEDKMIKIRIEKMTDRIKQLEDEQQQVDKAYRQALQEKKERDRKK